MGVATRLAIAGIRTWCLALMGAVPALAGVAAAPAVLPEADPSALRIVVEHAIAAGLSDAGGGTLYQGTIRLVAAGQPALPAHGAAAAASEPGYTGLHLQLADGTWIVDLTWPTTGLLGYRVDARAARALALDQVPDAAVSLLAAVDAGAADRAADAQAPPARAPWPAQVTGSAAIGALQRLLLQTGDLAVASAHLLRLGLPHSELLAGRSAGAWIWDPGSRALIEGWPSTLQLHALPDQGAARLAAAIAAHAWSEVPADAHLPDRETSFRHLLALSFYHQLIGAWPRPFLPLPPAAAAQAVLALEADQPGLPALRRELSGLVARAGLPTATLATSPLAQRLAVWCSDEREQHALALLSHLSDEVLDAIAGQSEEEQSRTPDDERDAWLLSRQGGGFSEADAGALVALLDDERPCRWLDQGRLRTVGDNALRALDAVLGCDPRSLVGHDPQAMWTDAERGTTIAALRRWWAGAAGMPLATTLAGALGRLTLEDVARQVRRGPAKSRAVVIAQLASLWRTSPPVDPQPELLASILAAGKGHPALTRVVMTWPVAGRAALLLTAWRLMHGDSQAFDAYWSAALAQRQDAGTEPPAAMARTQSLQTILVLAAHAPSPAHLGRVLALLAGPWEAPAGRDLLHALTRSWSQVPDQAVMMVCGPWELHAKGASLVALRAAAALPLAVYGTLLADQRPAPAWWLEEQAVSPRSAAEQRPLADHLRLCDIAAAIATRQLPAIIEPLCSAEDMQHITAVLLGGIDLGTGIRARDAAILALRRLIARVLPLACAAAALPAAVPGVTDVPQGGDSLSSF